MHFVCAWKIQRSNLNCFKCYFNYGREDQFLQKSHFQCAGQFKLSYLYTSVCGALDLRSAAAKKKRCNKISGMPNMYENRTHTRGAAQWFYLRAHALFCAVASSSLHIAIVAYIRGEIPHDATDEYPSTHWLYLFHNILLRR